VPQCHITDFAHYERLFGELFGELNRLTDADSEIAATAIEHAKLSVTFFFAIMIFGVLLGVTAIILEVVLSKYKKPRVSELMCL